MPVRVKICGLTDRVALEAAVGAGANAVGFVFAPSVREVTAERASRLSRDLPPEVDRVAVFRRPEPAHARDVLERFVPDWIQSDLADRSSFPASLPALYLPVVRAGNDLERQLAGVARSPGAEPPLVLLEGPESGAGRTIDWTVAAECAGRARIWLAGGLEPDNVAEAIRRVRPFGVDVSSGVESRPGVKDPRKIVDFIEAARDAATEIER